MAEPHDHTPPHADAARPAWSGEDATVGGGADPLTPRASGQRRPPSVAIPASDDSSAVAQLWSGEDVTTGGGSGAITPTPPSGKQATRVEPREESSSVSPVWNGEDATVGGGADPLTPRVSAGSTWKGEDATVGGGDAGRSPPHPASAWNGEDGTGAWNGQQAAVRPDPADHGDWLAQVVAAEAPQDPSLAADDLADASGSGWKEDLALWGAHTPIRSGRTPPAPPSTRTSSSGSDRLRRVGSADPAQIIETLRRKDGPWLDDGRSGELTGRVLGDFLVGAVLGQGGMGVVYRARQISLDRRVALKVLPPALAADPVLMERFAAEAHTASLLVSPHVVQIHFAGSVDDQVFFAMEFVSGTDLANLIASHRSAGTVVPAAEAGRLLAEAARGLIEAERNQVVHRDIKPQNLLLTADGVVKIADFGIAKVMGEHHLTLTGSAIGTPAYCSPEQGRGDQVDQRSDLYALGVVFYELLIGQKPFAGTQADQLIYQHNYTEPKPLRTLRPELPAAFETVCMRLLMKDPELRYQHATDLASDLEALITGGRVQAPAFEIRFGTGAQEAMRRHLGRRRWIPWTIAATLALGAGVALWLGNQSLEADEVVRHRAALATLDHVASVPRSAGADLAWLSTHLGSDDADVRRWQGKIARLEALRQRLARLDADQALPDAALRTACETDGAAWAAEVGGNDADYLRWQARLQAARDEIARLRGLLGELDRSDPVTVAQAQRLGPPLQRLTVLAGADDGERQRWQGLVDGQAQRLAAARSALGSLTAPADIPEQRLRMLRGEWRIHRAMVGDDDRETATWGRQLDQREAALQHLRDTGARLDRVDLATTTLQAEVAGDLERLAALVPATDPRLTAWRAKIDASNQRIAALRQGLGAALDAADHPDAGTLASCQRQLGEYRALVSPDDGRLAAWERRLAAEHQEVQDLTATLQRLDQEEPLTLVEQGVCQRAITELSRRGALGEDHRAAGGRRLAAESARIAGLRTLLAAAEQPGGGITPAVAAAVAALATATGGDDATVRRWQARLAGHQRLREALAILDQVAPLPVEALQLLSAYGELVPAADADLVRWSAKTARIAALQRQLGPLLRREAVPAGARAGLDELAERLTGPQDALVVAGRAKLARLAELEATLGVLDHALVLPADRDLGAALGAWADLVGSGDGRWQAWSLRQRQLAGPGRPVWATLHGRDAQGPWAELVVNGNRQRLRFIPGGTMRLGSPSDEAGRDADEAPPHAVSVEAFWLADSECTQSLYAALLFAWPAQHRVPDRPVVEVSRADALRFCTALSKAVAGVEARLPSETEWEYACRAGADGPYSGPDGNLSAARLGEVAWFARDDAPRPVRLLQPNRFGIHDCHGNVWEWVADRYLGGDGRASGDDGVVRGGSWADRATLLRAANRMALDPERRSSMVGFRFAISAVWPDGSTQH